MLIEFQAEVCDQLKYEVIEAAKRNGETVQTFLLRAIETEVEYLKDYWLTASLRRRLKGD